MLSINTQPLLFVAINAIKQLDSANTVLVKKDSAQQAAIKDLMAKDSVKDGQIQTLQNQMNQLVSKTNNQDSINTSLQDQLNQLLNCCNNHNNGNGNGHGNNLMQSSTNNYKSVSSTKLTDVELSNKNIVVLDQNVPNPFAEQTTISYYLPDNITRAQIIFIEQSGKIIKAIDLTERGKGQLNVFANDLTNGIYTYSLIVNGQTIETKKMVKTK